MHPVQLQSGVEGFQSGNGIRLDPRSSHGYLLDEGSEQYKKEVED